MFVEINVGRLILQNQMFIETLFKIEYHSKNHSKSNVQISLEIEGLSYNSIQNRMFKIHTKSNLVEISFKIKCGLMWSLKIE